MILCICWFVIFIFPCIQILPKPVMFVRENSFGFVLTCTFLPTIIIFTTILKFTTFPSGTLYLSLQPILHLVPIAFPTLCPILKLLFLSHHCCHAIFLLSNVVNSNMLLFSITLRLNSSTCFSGLPNLLDFSQGPTFLCYIRPSCHYVAGPGVRATFQIWAASQVWRGQNKYF